MSRFEITLGDIQAAHERIAPHVVRTPLLRHSGPASGPGGAGLKLENLQTTGSFKIRGATNRMLGLSAAARRRGVVAVSSGNHGRAVAHVAASLGIDAVICLAESVPAHKVEAIRGLGAKVQIAGETYDEASAQALRLERDDGRVPIHPFDDPRVIAGQGTIGLEIIEDQPETGCILVPLSGGGLISGIALAVKALRPAIRIIGVSMERAPVMHHCLRAGKLVTLRDEPTLADALAGGLGGANHFTFGICQELLDDTVLVTESAIAAAMAALLDEHHLVVEGGGAVGVAALMSGVVPLEENTVVVVSGGNVDLERLLRIMSERVGRPDARLMEGVHRD